MTEESDQQEPLFVTPIGARYSVNDIAEALARNGVTHGKAHARVRIYAKAELIKTRDKPKNARLFSVAEIGVAKILSDLQDMGIQDHEVLEAASIACYAWPEGITPPQDRLARIHPILAAIKGIPHREAWAFRLDVFRNSTQRFCTACVCPATQSLDLSKFTDDPAWIHVGTFKTYFNDSWVPMIMPLLAN